MWQQRTGVRLRDLSDVAFAAPVEDLVINWIERRTEAIDKDALNAELESLTTDRIPESWRDTFEATYPEHLRKRFVNVFDLLEADNERECF